MGVCNSVLEEEKNPNDMHFKLSVEGCELYGLLDTGVSQCLYNLLGWLEEICKRESKPVITRRV